jgi:hypothetical protein
LTLPLIPSYNKSPNVKKTTWTDDEVAFLLENYPHKDNRTLAAELGRPTKQLTLKADRLRAKGIVLCKSAEQSARQPRGDGRRIQIGDISAAGRNTDRVWNGRGYTALHRWNYEQAHGPIGRREILVCLDGNPRNYDVSNWKPRTAKVKAKPKAKPKPKKMKAAPTPRKRNTPPPVVNIAPLRARADEWSESLKAEFAKDYGAGMPVAEMKVKYALQADRVYSFAHHLKLPQRLNATYGGAPAQNTRRRADAGPVPQVTDYAALITFVLAYLDAPTAAGFAADQGMSIDLVRNRMEDIRVKFKKHPSGLIEVDGVEHNLREIAARSRRTAATLPALNVGGGAGKAASKRAENNAAVKRRKRWTHTPDGGREMTNRERQAAQVANKVAVQVWCPRMERYDTVYRNRPAA